MSLDKPEQKANRFLITFKEGDLEAQTAKLRAFLEGRGMSLKPLYEEDLLSKMPPPYLGGSS